MSTPEISPSLSQDSHVSLNSRVGVRRIAALCFDFGVLLLVQLWISSAFGILFPWSLAGSSLIIPPVTPDAAWFTRDWFGEALLVVVYFSLQEALFGTTLGKFIARLRVTDKQGQRPALAAILLRNVLRLVDLLPIIFINLGAITFSIPYVIGGIVAIITRRRQRLGDLVAGTLVVDAASIPLSSLSSHTVLALDGSCSSGGRLAGFRVPAATCSAHEERHHSWPRNQLIYDRLPNQKDRRSHLSSPVEIDRLSWPDHWWILYPRKGSRQSTRLQRDNYNALELPHQWVENYSWRVAVPQ